MEFELKPITQTMLEDYEDGVRKRVISDLAKDSVAYFNRATINAAFDAGILTTEADFNGNTILPFEIVQAAEELSKHVAACRLPPDPS